MLFRSRYLVASARTIVLVRPDGSESDDGGDEDDEEAGGEDAGQEEAA